jgi:signal transduction histidine kinase
MFDDFEQGHTVPRYRYDTYDQAIDGASEAIAALDRAAIDQGDRGRESSRHTSDVLTAAIGLLALLGAVLGGVLIGSRIARPLVALRNAAIAFGAGRLDVVVAPTSTDEVGELASAFARMATEREHLEARLATAHKLEALGSVAGSVAHDFNNVLGAILTCSELAQEAVGDDHTISPDLREIADAVRRGASLTQQLLAFSRPQTASPRILSVNGALQSIEPMLTRLAGAQVKVRLTLDPEGPLVRVDPTQLDQVLMNLVVNARDATPRGGEVEIRTSTVELEQPATMTTGSLDAGLYAVVEVRDEGTGMDETTVARLFEPFFTTKQPGKGTGLGLATVLRNVLQAGGVVALESVLGRGTTFRVYLPLAAERRSAGYAALRGKRITKRVVPSAQCA